MMKNSSSIIFKLFRYQILPVSRDFQLSIDSNFSTLNELVKIKNNLFAEALNSTSCFSHLNHRITHRVQEQYSNYIFLQIGQKKDKIIHDQDFKLKQIEDWPFTRIFINNDPNEQIIAIEFDGKAFTSPYVVAKMLAKTLSKHLRRMNLKVYIEPIYREMNFWETVKEFETKIIQVNFELISPNLSNISKSLKIDLRKLKERTNTHKTKLQLSAPEGSHLILKEDEGFIDGCVKYSANGGGESSIKVKGLKKTIKMSDQIIEYSVDEATFKNMSGEQISVAIKGMIENENN